MTKRRVTGWHGLGDFLVLCLLLGAVNALLDRNDPGWLGMNPTPWLLPAALVGARYGFLAGLLSGLGISAGIIAVRSWMNGTPAEDIFKDHDYFFLAITVLGAVAGELGTRLSARRHRLESTLDQVTEENTRVLTQLHVLDETRHELQQRLALFNAPLSGLDDDLRALFTRPPEEFNQQLLHILHRCTGITSAGIYALDGSVLRRIAAIHPTAPLTESLPLQGTPLAFHALNTGALASVSDAGELTTTQPFLAAFPWRDHLTRSCVLLVQDMPYEEYSLQQLSRLELILSWTSAMGWLRRSLTAHARRNRLISAHEFQLLLAEALHADQRHGLPSALIRLTLTSRVDAETLWSALPVTAMVTKLTQANEVAILLPFSGHEEASNLVRDLGEKVQGTRTQLYLTAGQGSAETLWMELNRHEPAAAIAPTVPTTWGQRSPPE